jgi:glycosyltransferase involved in cell wall biosynthesis
MAKKRPTITAHCIVKNEEVYIKAAVMSVLPHVDKMIIFDTGSTDATPGILADIYEKYSKKIHYEKKGLVDKQGHTKLRDEMIKMTNTDWIMLLDGDEIWDKSQIENVVEELSYQPDYKYLGLVSYHLLTVNLNYYTERGHFVFPWGMHNQLTPRFLRNVGIEFKGEYLGEELLLKNKKIKKLQKHYFVSTSFYYHLSKLPRSSKDNEVWERRKPGYSNYAKALVKFFAKRNYTYPQILKESS